MPPMIRKRTGTGELYVANQPRSAGSDYARRIRRSRAVRGDNTLRPWLSEDAETIAFNFAAVLQKTKQEWQEMLDVFAWVGEVVHFCLRRRVPMDEQARADSQDWLQWFIVLHTVGLLDRKGAWLGPALELSDE